ncbi:hypothetical protein AAC387_Pa11g2089 [Persea americana]
MSTAILELADSGDLQRIRDKWLIRPVCSPDSTELVSNQLHLKSLLGLLLICGLVCFMALTVYFVLIIRSFSRHVPNEPDQSSQGISHSRHLQRFLTFANEKEATVMSRSKRRQIEESNRGSTNTERRQMGGTSSIDMNMSTSPS